MYMAYLKAEHIINTHMTYRTLHEKAHNILNTCMTHLKEAALSSFQGHFVCRTPSRYRIQTEIEQRCQSFSFVQERHFYNKKDYLFSSFLFCFCILVVFIESQTKDKVDFFPAIVNISHTHTHTHTHIHTHTHTHKHTHTHTPTHKKKQQQPTLYTFCG